MRTRNTKKDDNHNVVTDFMRICGGFEKKRDGRTNVYTCYYRGYFFVAHDTADFGGFLPDWILECKDTQRIRWLEVKSEGAFLVGGTLGAGQLKDGEAWLADNSDCWRLIVTDEDVQGVFAEMIRE